MKKNLFSKAAMLAGVLALCAAFLIPVYAALSTSTTPNLGLSNGFNDGAMTMSSALNTNFTVLDSLVPKFYGTGSVAAFATATTAGTCAAQQTATVNGATTAMVAVASPVSTPGVGAVWSASVTAANTVTLTECAVATSAGGSIAFNIRVFN